MMYSHSPKQSWEDQYPGLCWPFYAWGRGCSSLIVKTLIWLPNQYEQNKTWLASTLHLDYMNMFDANHVAAIRFMESSGGFWWFQMFHFLILVDSGGFPLS